MQGFSNPAGVQRRSLCGGLRCETPLITPTLTIINPENETYITSEFLPLNYVVSLENFVWYNLDNSANTTITGNTTFNTTFAGHTLYLYAYNTNGETAKNVIFTADETNIKVYYNEYKQNVK